MFYDIGCATQRRPTSSQPQPLGQVLADAPDVRRRLLPLLIASAAAQHSAAAGGTCRCQECVQPRSIRSCVAAGGLQYDVEGALQCGEVSVTGMTLHS